jgi:sec-independent protein translocase protein TatB
MDREVNNVRIGMTELIVIFVVALFVVGPDRLPMYAKKLGEALAQFKKISDDATKDIKESIVEPLEEAQRPLKEAIEPITELDKAVRDNVKDVQKSFNSIGKPKKNTPAKKDEEKPESEVEPETQTDSGNEAAPEGDKTPESEAKPTDSQESVPAAGQEEAESYDDPGDEAASTSEDEHISDKVHVTEENPSEEPADEKSVEQEHITNIKEDE